MEDISKMVGKTMVRVARNDPTIHGDVLEFEADDGTVFTFSHYQDCCEYVRIEDLCGDLDDLVGHPILLAECITSKTDDLAVGYINGHSECFTWTFYKFATLKGSVTVRWLGESNGYYSEEVSLEIRVA